MTCPQTVWVGYRASAVGPAEPSRGALAPRPDREFSRARLAGHRGPQNTCAIRERPADAAEEAFDLLYGFTEHRLPQQDVYPGVQDGVHRSNSDGLQIRVFADDWLQLWPI